MFQSLKASPPDPILGLMATFAADDSPHKIDLGVGVYRDATGNTPVMAAVKQAEAALLREQQTKAYVGPFGAAGFSDCIAELLLTAELKQKLGPRRITVQTPGGCGGLRLAAEFMQQAGAASKVWVSDPTWANHVPMLGAAGLEIATYPYYDRTNHSVRFDDMLGALAKAKAGDVLLLHGCCHNPCGADLNGEQWQAVRDLVLDKGMGVLVDLAYHGFGDGLDEDVAGVRLMAESLPEMIVVSSCSKNFGLYRERAGALTLIAAKEKDAATAATCLSAAARALYSMPPDHGAAVVQHILQDAKLCKSWESELRDTRQRINGVRQQLVKELAAAKLGDFSFIAREKGMFSYLGITPEQVKRLTEEFSVYLVDSSRINVASINDRNINHFIAALGAVL